jgi:hypothetical protein
MNHPLVARMVSRVGRRGVSLLFFALLDLVVALSLAYAPPEAMATPTYQFLQAVAPLLVWALAWGLVGVTCLVQAFMRSDRLAFAAASALKVVWGLLYLIGWLIADIPRGYISATIWLALAGFVQIIAGWRENGGHEWTQRSS